MAKSYDVVTVTHNHRLGLFGYLYLGGLLGEEYAASGCAGILDIAAVLEWIILMETCGKCWLVRPINARWLAYLDN